MPKQFERIATNPKFSAARKKNVFTVTKHVYATTVYSISIWE